jgi:cytidine deaminase
MQVMIKKPINFSKELQQLLKLAKAPISKRKVSCILEQRNSDKRFCGFNIETKTDILHAEHNALFKKTKNRFYFNKIHIMASGSQFDIKNAIPCENCSKLLLPHSTTNSKIIFYTSDGKLNYILNFRKLVSKYRPFKNCINLRSDKIDEFLEEKTPLTKVDMKWMTELCNLIIEHNLKDKKNIIKLYMTGSASGRGGPKTVLAKKITGNDYGADVDLLFIFTPNVHQNTCNILVKTFYKQSFKNIGLKVKNIYSKKMSSYKLENFEKNDKNFLFRKLYCLKARDIRPKTNLYEKDKNEPSVLDASAGYSLNSIITKKYLKKNWYIQLI